MNAELGLRWIRRAVLAAIGLALAATLAWAAVAFLYRTPAWGEVEVLFEADRLRAGLPLYVHPSVGAFDYGVVPTRYYVTYPPLWALVGALFPAAVRTSALRAACTAAWAYALTCGPLGATRSAQGRGFAWALAAYYGGFWILANLATTGRPDAVAIALVAWALRRTLREGRLDERAALAFALAVLVKPTVLSVFASVAVVELLSAPRRAWRPLALAASAALGGVALLHVLSHGAWWRDLADANLQPMRVQQWLDNMPRLLFFGPPALLVALSLRTRRHHDHAARLGLAAVGGSFAVTYVMLGKVGSSSNYWLEHAAAVVVVASRFAPHLKHETPPPRSGEKKPGSVPPRPLASRVAAPRLAFWALVLAQVSYVDVASVRSSLEGIEEERTRHAFAPRIARACPGLVMSDFAGLEYRLDGRVVTTGYQLFHAILAGKLDEELLVEMLRSPDVVCFVETNGLFRGLPHVREVLTRDYVSEADSRFEHVFVHRAPPTAR